MLPSNDSRDTGSQTFLSLWLNHTSCWLWLSVKVWWNFKWIIRFALRLTTWWSAGMATGMIHNVDAIPLLKPPPVYFGIFMIFHNFPSPFLAKLMSHTVCQIVLWTITWASYIILQLGLEEQCSSFTKHAWAVEQEKERWPPWLCSEQRWAFSSEVD